MDEFVEMCRQNTNPAMERGRAKDFATYVYERAEYFALAERQVWADLYQNFCEDEGIEP